MMKTLREWLKWAYQEQQKFRKLAMNLADKANFLASWTAPCCICNEEFDGCEEESKVVHHSHLTGDIHGVAHRKCNLDCSVMKFLPVFFHNFSRYDSHHIIKDLEIYDGEELNAIAKTDETFISFSVRVPVGSYVDKRGLTKCIKSDIRFLDSLNFMASGLDALAQTLSDEDLSLLKQNFSPDSEEMFKKIRRKGFFPYGYLDSSEKFDAPFPDYGPDWVNTLSGKIDLTLEQYQEAREMYHLMGCKNFGDYHDVYLKIDVLLLASVFEKFRDVCLDVYNLDPACFYSAPNLSWDAMLVTTGVELELLQDYDMLLFCEKAIRGGLNGVGSLRYFKANNKYIPDFKSNETSVFGAFFDVTSLYAGTMMKKLPIGSFEWDDTLTVETISAHDCEGEYAFFVEVDLAYPSELHIDHQDLPLAPEKLVIQSDWLSEYCSEFNEKRNADVPKLQKIFWDKPTPVGAAILDLSKLSLYGFHYNEMKPRYGQKILVTYKDTDSLLYRVETDDLYEDMKEFKHLLDLSDYPSDHPLFDPTNKKVPLTMTDELNGQILEEAVLLRSKMYSIKYRGGAKQSAKGVQKSVKKSLHHDKFVNCLKNRTTERAPMTRITSENHQIIVTMTNKIALSCFDDKRYIFEPGIDTLPHGHFWLNQERESSKHANGDCETSFYQFCESDGGESSTESASDCSELSLVGQQNNSDERAAAATDTFDVPDPGFLPRDLHADSDESNIVDWDALSTTDDAEESDSRRNPFIDDEAIEEADRVDDEANDDEDGYDDVDDCGGGGGGLWNG
ncbi:uncharacterized protein LOC142335839 [Convolutriloba macropyga]|uniref:uncharacterized protein LOC142335839 n=1 Tax=Convolutriloba macropyga TaxID=536237 RepID=UPI003F528F98